MSRKTIQLKGASKAKKQQRVNSIGNYWIDTTNYSIGKDGNAIIIHKTLRKPKYTPLSIFSKLQLEAEKKAA